MIKVVIDTNVLISSNLSNNGSPAKIMKLYYLKELQIFYSQEILDEYIRVLAYRRFDFSISIQTAVVDAILKGGICIDPPVSSFFMPDETDRSFYDTTIASGSILITGNKKDFPKESFIVTPSEFLFNYISN